MLLKQQQLFQETMFHYAPTLSDSIPENEARTNLITNEV